MNILVIDDDDDLRLGLRELLELSGHTVRDAGDGAEGVALAAERPDLIFCDVDMPGMNGFEAIIAIQRLPQCRDVPFIFLTGRSDREDQRRGMTLGADDFITKPFQPTEILDAIAARVRRQKPLRERVEQLITERHQVAAADWSHELMTPLNAVLGGLDMIESEADTIKPDELKELLGLIRQGAERQQHLSRKLVRFFSLERMQAGTAARTSAGNAETAVAGGAMQAAQAEQREADVKITAEPARVAIDETTLAGVVGELVENALRFSKRGQGVTVTGQPAGNLYRISIADEGPGMTAEQRAGTGAFVQFDRGRREQQGLGLGLAIARSAATLSRGRLALEEGPGGRGLRAVLEVPLAS